MTEPENLDNATASRRASRSAGRHAGPPVVEDNASPRVDPVAARAHSTAPVPSFQAPTVPAAEPVAQTADQAPVAQGATTEQPGQASDSAGDSADGGQRTRRRGGRGRGGSSGDTGGRRESGRDGGRDGGRQSEGREGNGRGGRNQQGRGGNGRGGNGNGNGGNGRGRGSGNGGGNGGGVQSMQGRDLTRRLPPPPRQAADSLRLVALGGISEIGRNMTVFEYRGKLLIVDCGVLFPGSTEPGVDLILPDFAYIENRLKDVEALVLTHAHEDHIGGIPFLLKLRPDIPVVGSRFTLALVAAKCREHRLRPKFIEVRENETSTHGEFSVKYWAVNHSIPDALGLAITTGAGTIVHTGDIKLDQTPPDKRPTDLPALSRIGDAGVDLLLIDSTNASVKGFSASESDVIPTINRLIEEAKQRVIIACFASNVARVQTIVNAAVKANRKVALVGRSMVRNMEIAQQLGFLEVPANVLIDIEEASRLAPHKVVLVTTGTQGEPMAALSRMSRGEHRQIKVAPGDLIILASSLVPGNEEAVYGVINDLAQIGAKVITNKDASVHVSGHGFAGELLFLYNAARPRNVMPVHGEWRHLRDNKELAIRTGVHPDNVVLAQNGVVVDLHHGRASVAGQIPVGHLYVDGLNTGDVGEEVLADRTALGEGGFIAVTVVVDQATARPVQKPQIVAKGFSEEVGALYPLTEIVENALLDKAGEGENDPYRLAQAVKRAVTKWTTDKWRRSPMIVPTVVTAASEEAPAAELDNGIAR